MRTINVENIDIPNDVREAMIILLKHGFQAFIVGGAVRDMLLGLQPNDFDIATNARPDTIIQIFSSLGWKAIPTGIEYGTVTVVHPATHREIEITTFRREIYIEERGRKPIVTFADSLEEDVMRRDFTINALAIDINGNIIDLVGGLEDIKNGVIRFIGDADVRIREDPLRMLRALRFAAKLGFSIDPASLEAIKRNKEQIRRVSMERIRDEFIKAAKTKRFAMFIELLVETGLAEIIMPELLAMTRVFHANTAFHHGESVFQHTIEVLRRLDSINASPLLKIAALLHDIGKTAFGEGTHEHFYNHEIIGVPIAENILRRLRFSNSEISYIITIVRNHMVPLTMNIDNENVIARRLVARFGEIAIDLLIHTYADTGDARFLAIANIARDVVRRLSIKPVINGNHIVRAFPERQPGPWIGQLKHKLYEIQLELETQDPIRIISEAARRQVISAEEAERLMRVFSSR